MAEALSGSRAMRRASEIRARKRCRIGVLEALQDRWMSGYDDERPAEVLRGECFAMLCS